MDKIQLTEELVEEIAKRLGIERGPEDDDSDIIGDDELEDLNSDSDETVDIFGESQDLSDDSTLEYPWPISVVTGTRVASDGSVRVDAVLDFEEIPGAVDYEIRIVPA